MVMVRAGAGGCIIVVVKGLAEEADAWAAHPTDNDRRDIPRMMRIRTVIFFKRLTSVFLSF